MITKYLDYTSWTESPVEWKQKAGISSGSLGTLVYASSFSLPATGSWWCPGCDSTRIPALLPGAAYPDQQERADHRWHWAGDNGTVGRHWAGDNGTVGRHWYRHSSPADPTAGYPEANCAGPSQPWHTVYHWWKTPWLGSGTLLRLHPPLVQAVQPQRSNPKLHIRLITHIYLRTHTRV